MASPKPTFCPICSHKLTEREEGGRLRPVCDRCGYIHYVNPVPGVGLLIEMDGGVVLVQRGSPPHAGRWALPSGFVEADESAEEAAIREAEEETGLKIEIVELADINSFPEGPPVSGIMIFYRARPIGGQLRAGDDAADVRVFRPDELPPLPFRTHREMLAKWLASLQTAHKAAHTAEQERPFTIRPARPGDTDEVLALLALIPGNRELSEDEWRAAAQRLRESLMVEVYVAEEMGSPPLIIGCVALSVVRALTEGMAVINDMAVLPTFQRRGVGAELLKAAMRRAAALDLRSIWVNTQRANDQARAFYAALGFSDLEVLRIRIR